jgi:triosephosphate isomerase (TIM)
LQKIKGEIKVKYVIGNWKMNGDADLLASFSPLAGDGIVLCVPFHLLNASAGNIEIGAQDCSANKNGAFTGEISAEMIAESGISYCIVGHSERRTYWKETNDLVAAKASRLLENNITPIICVGETLEQKQAGKTLEVIENQVWQSIPKIETIHGEIIIAYEPVWAIGTGLVPTMEDIENVHNFIANILKKMGLPKTAILYGGSVKATNAADIMNIENVGGVLVGGASLDPIQFKGIIDGRK